jgi:hypothetical protein
MIVLKPARGAERTSSEVFLSELEIRHRTDNVDRIDVILFRASIWQRSNFKKVNAVMNCT